MDDKLNSSFVNAANALSALFKESQNQVEESYQRGKADFYQEVLKWMLDSHNGDIRYVTVENLMEFVNNCLSQPRSISQEIPIEYPLKKFKPSRN
ncbi:unnamed protein product [Blepharisma stoltei]|uniref:Uncharacterized protein n=1 Tax=Blepharisma stoltei TaxID=1481888 RepID=A0AAU9K6D5_9CILI|nr:unnamed protein product [Blepharisma stoltei]